MCSFFFARHKFKVKLIQPRRSYTCVLLYRKVKLILPLPLIAATPTYCCASPHCQDSANPDAANQYGWPFPSRSVVVDPLKMHVKTLEPPLAGSCCGGPLRAGPWLWAGPWPRAGPWPPQAGPGPPLAGPGPPLAGPTLCATSTDSSPVGFVNRCCWRNHLRASLRAIGTSPQMFHGHWQDWHPDRWDSDCPNSCHCLA